MADAAEKRKAPEEAAEAGAKTEEPPAKKAEVEPAAKEAEKAAEPAAKEEEKKEAEKAAEPAAKEEEKKVEPAKEADTAKPADTKAREKPAAADEPESKRLKPTPPDPKAVRKQVEYYLSDENLRYDKFFSEKISADKDGWLDMTLVLSCNKMQAIRATKEDVIEALKESKIEVKDGGSAVRRPANAALPKLEARPTHPKKSSAHAHDGGVITVLTGVPEEQSWTQVKEKLKEKLPAKVQIWHVSEVNDKGRCFVCTSPFDNDQTFLEALQIEVGGAKLKCEVCSGELLQQALKLVPKHVKDKRDRESRKRQKERNRPILVGTQRFVNVAALRGRVKEILNSRSDGEQLKPDGSDFKLIKALLGYHPKGDEKSQGLTGMKVAKSDKGESRCFYMIKEGGVEEDFSAKKCLDAIEANPPYVQNEPKKEAKASGSAPAEKKPADAKPAEEKKAEEAKPEEKKAEEAKPAEEEKKEEKKAEEAKPAEEEKKEEKKEEPKAEEEAKPAEEEKKEDKAEEAKPAEEAKAA